MIVIPPKKNMQEEKQVEPLAVSSKDAARLLSVCEKTVRNLAKEGKIARKKIG